MSFISPQFTNAGKKLQARALSGDAQITFTQMGLGDGELATQSISALTDLINPIKKIDISDLRVINPDQVQLKAVFQNIGMVGFFWREVGLFAADPDNPDDRTKDILYCYQNAQDLAEYIPSGDSQLVDKILNMSVVVADATQVKISFFSESYALKEDLDEQIALQARNLDAHKTDPNAHGNLFAQYVKKSGDTMNGKLTFSLNDAIYRNDDTSYLHLCGGNVFGKSASLILNGGQNLDGSSSYGGFELSATNGEDMTNLVGQSTGALTWGNKNLVRSVNGVNADAQGNVTIPTAYVDYSNGVDVTSSIKAVTSTSGYRIPYNALLLIMGTSSNNCVEISTIQGVNESTAITKNALIHYHGVLGTSYLRYFKAGTYLYALTDYNVINTGNSKFILYAA